MLKMLGRLEMHTIKTLIPGPSSLVLKLLLKKYKSPGTDAILAEQLQAGGNTLCSKIHTLNNSIWNKE
jgi:hypothetical protein